MVDSKKGAMVGSKKESNASAAIADYMGDLLASIPEQRQAILGPKEEEDKRKEEERIAKRKKAALRARSSAIRKTSHPHNDVIESPSSPLPQTPAVEAEKRPVKKPRAVQLKTLLEEPSLSRHITASPVIKSTLPKPLELSPDVPAVEEKQETKPATEKVDQAVKEKVAVDKAPVTRDLSQVVQEPAPAISTAKGLSPGVKEEPKVVDASPAIVTKPNTPAESLSEDTLEREVIKPPPEWSKNGRPSWAQGRFECLLFKVAGLKLAVPLVSLGSIHKLEEELTPLVGRASWFMGLYPNGDRNINVVDTARWVMPDRAGMQARDNYKFVIRLGGCNWGMACDTVESAIQLEPEQVRWRTERSKRPWLSGTVIDQMCALLDADALGYLLAKDMA